MSNLYSQQKSSRKTLASSRWGSILGASLILLFTSHNPAWSSEDSEKSEHSHHHLHMDHSNHINHGNHMEMDEHAMHRAAIENPKYSVTTRQYDVPEVTLIDKTGTNVSLKSLLNSDQPIALNFIFTTCNTICPVMTATFAQMRKQLGKAGSNMKLISISIDPEYDRPPVLSKYAKLFEADSDWTFLTGDSKDISHVLTRFNALSGSKMNHRPLTLLKQPNSTEWIRIDGLASSTDLTREVTTRLLN